MSIPKTVSVFPKTDTVLNETIIVVEDSAPNRRILVQILRKIGYEVLEASEGSGALKLVESLKTQPSLKLVAIIADIMMSPMDGLSLLREIRQDKAFENLPFVFVTAMADRETMLHAKDLRADGYLLKPVTLNKILKKLRELLPSKEFAQIVGG